jgi:hypothetical protein
VNSWKPLDPIRTQETTASERRMTAAAAEWNSSVWPARRLLCFGGVNEG